MRIRLSDLRTVCERINRTAGTPTEPYRKNADGTFAPNAKAYHLSSAYGGYALHQMSEQEGCTGIRDVLRSGHIPKRDLYNQMHAYVAGMGAAVV